MLSTIWPGAKGGHSLPTDIVFRDRVGPSMRIYIASTLDAQESCRRAALEVVRELGHQPVVRDPVARPWLDRVTACGRQIAMADALLAIVGRRPGPGPSVTEGGDGLRPWTHWEVRSAFEHQLPVVALLEEGSMGAEEDAEAAAAMADLRGELVRLGDTFADEAGLRRAARRLLQAVERQSWTPGVTPGGLSLRRFPPPVLPPHPYPLLLPYTHPELMAGRDHDLADLRRTLARPLSVVGLYAVSGVGKSSLLSAGLIPTLRAEGRPVAFDRFPTEPGLRQRLLADLLEGDLLQSDPETSDHNGRTEAQQVRDFVDRLLIAYRLADGVPPVLVIDQFEDLLKDSAEPALAALGPLMAASAQRLPGLDQPVCRWLLAYRQEFHGRVVAWLQDVLRGGTVPGLALPHNLSRSSRFADWPLRPLATPPAGAGDPVEAATRVFADAVEKPLARAEYLWSFAPGHAERLARAFGEARIRRPDDPLVPELQVVLAHLMERAGEPSGGAPCTVRVPDEVGELIERALEQHLRRALDLSFPHGSDATLRVDRSRALLVLRELADDHGRRKRGDDAALSTTGLGKAEQALLDRLSTAQTRLVLRQRQDDQQVYVLAHDRLAELVVRVVDQGEGTTLGVDRRLLGLRRFVVLQSQLFAAGDGRQATAMPAKIFASLRIHQEVLLWNETQQAWWQACVTSRRAEGRLRGVRRALAAMVVTLVALAAWWVADQRARRQALLEEIVRGEPDTAFAALDRWIRQGRDPGQALDRLRKREFPFDIFERGLGGVDEPRRAEALVRAAELAMPLLYAAPEDPKMIASLVWALDFFAARDSAFTELALALRDQALEPLRRRRPPPPSPGPDDPDWADIPAGTFWMGAGPDEGRDQPDMQSEYPRHRVSISAFRMLKHEVTNAEYRRLVPDHQGEDDHPAFGMNWYEAYTYAAWAGGRLPTEAEWEYTARAGCNFAYCKHDGSEASLDEVAWWRGNPVKPKPFKRMIRPVQQLEPNPLGLWDIYGNVWEWCANWNGPYPSEGVQDPTGPLASSNGVRQARSGSAFDPSAWVWASGRGGRPPDFRSPLHGLRPVLGDTEP